jgi:SAM-dependent methyltransferase
MAGDEDGCPVTEKYEYRGMIAQAWDLLRGDYSTWPDRPFWRGIIERQDGPALDVGCGTGRLLLDYLAAGLDVDGVDNSPEMLAVCREKAAAAGVDVAGRLFEQSMDALDLPRRYATIFVPSLSFQLLTDLGAARSALTRFLEHLTPGGVLVASFKVRLWPGRRTPPQMEWSDWFKLAEAQRPEDGLLVRRWVRGMYDHEQQLEHEENRYELMRAGQVIETENHSRSPCVRWWTLDQALAAFEQAGFADVRATSGDTHEPASSEDNLFKVWGARPQALKFSFRPGRGQRHL